MSSFRPADRSLVIWEGKPTSITHCGLMHSAYSNSYVNLAIFPPDESRPVVKALVGDETEDLIYTFCVINRQQVIIDNLVNKFPDHVLRSKGIQELVPREGIVTKHIRTGEEVKVSRRVLAQFVFLTMVGGSLASLTTLVSSFFGWF